VGKWPKKGKAPPRGTRGAKGEGPGARGKGQGARVKDNSKGKANQ
jgi:hypothetical protein